MRTKMSRVGSALAALTLFGIAIVGTALPAAAAMHPSCALYAETTYRAAGRTYFASTTTCGFTPYAAYSQAQLQRFATAVATAPAATSSAGASSLRSASWSTSCSTGSYRTYAWGNDIFTGATEKAGAYSSITC